MLVARLIWYMRAAAPTFDGLSAAWGDDESMPCMSASATKTIIASVLYTFLTLLSANTRTHIIYADVLYSCRAHFNSQKANNGYSKILMFMQITSRNNKVSFTQLIFYTL